MAKDKGIRIRKDPAKEAMRIGIANAGQGAGPRSKG